MDKKEALEIVKKQLTDHRYEHTLGVVKTAKKLASLYNVDVEQAQLAAIFHDYAKFRPKEEMKQIIIEEKMEPDLLLYGTELWHAPVGAFLVKKEVGIQDEEVLNAIRYHTTGRPNMTKLEKVVFLADFIEPNRSFKGVEKARELAKESLNEAVLFALQHTTVFLMKHHRSVYPGTIFTYNSLIKELKSKGEQK